MVRSVALLALLVPAAFSQQQPFTVEAMLKIARISEPQLSPDGKLVAFTVQTVDVDNNSKPTQIYVVTVAGGLPRQITREGNNDRPRWTPDSRQLVFSSTRTGASQIWTMDPNGDGAKPVTSISTEAAGHTLSPDGKKLIFLSRVYPECSTAPEFNDACNKEKMDAEVKSKLKARAYTSLLYRHWTDWKGKRRQHLLSMNLDGGDIADLTPVNRDVPPFSLGGADGYAIAPDSTEAAYVTNTDPDLATSTNSDIFVVPIGGGESKRITANPGADDSPVYSPDGRYLAYRSQTRGGYESDRWRLVVLERGTGKLNVVTEALDRSVQSMTWAPDSTRLFFVSEDRGRHGLQLVSAGGGALRSIISAPSSLDDVQFSKDGKTLIYTEQTGARPAEIFRASSTGGAAVALTHLNDDLLSQYSLQALDEFWVEGADGARIHSFMAKPPGFQMDHKFPVLFLIHGGPQGAWGEQWSYRWNAQVFAAAGFLVIMPNPRGSTGYGQKFTDEINSDWGGKAFTDIMAVVEHVSSEPFADPDRMAVAGGSYGGYMVDWMLGHTDRFKAFVSHAGVYDLRSMAGETEELWFPLWEFKGMPWDDPETYAKWSPSYFVKNFKTPTLVINGEQDFRVPFGQGLQLFTALQTQKVPSKLLVFPDEGHWVLKPQNSLLWYHTFLDWVIEWTRPSTPPPAK